MKNCIVYLLRSSIDDINMINKSLSLLENNLMCFTNSFDIIIFHEKDLGELKNGIISNHKLIYYEIEMGLPDYNDEIKLKIPEFYPHPTHANGPVAFGHPGFTIGYRNMCRFFLVSSMNLKY